MKITDLLAKDAIRLGADVTDRQAAIEYMIGLQEKAGHITSTGREVYRDAILAREKSGTTAIGEGIAIPHAKSDAVKRPGLAAITVPAGVDWGAPDGRPSTLIFMIAAPRDGDLHLEVLSHLMVLLMDEHLRAELMAARSPEAFREILDGAERARFDAEQGATVSTEGRGAEHSACRVLAVTACPTGIAHTYMAAEALTKAGDKLGISVKVETDGSGGVKNALTRDEIAAADCIIVAVDREVEMARFEGKRVIRTKVADGIHKAEELLARARDGGGTIYHHEGGPAETLADGDGEHFGRRVYKHLMNGVSHMLPFVIGGGIMTALAFLIDTIAGAPADADFGSYTAVASFFKSIGGIAFGFMLPILAGYISMSIADRPGLAVGFVGGSIAGLGCTFAAPAGDAAAVSGFLGALIAGFAGGLIVLFLRKISSILPHSMEGIRPVLIYPLFGIILIGALMCAINPAVGWLNTIISNGLQSMGSTSRVLLGALLGGMMAIDMGGPFNKAAYVFGTAAIASGSYEVMASVMIGGMIPPLALALATGLFRRKFTSEERRSGPVNYIMGLCFITEGAIPYAAADPLRVIPACVLGSASAGALSMALGCTLQAPHGGIFVFPVVGNVLGYVIALLAGTVVATLALGLFKRKINV